MEPCLCNEPHRGECLRRAPFGIVDIEGEELCKCELFERELANERTLSLLMSDDSEARC